MHTKQDSKKGDNTVLFANKIHESQINEVCIKAVENESKAETENWYVDSGASCHMTNNKNKLRSIHDVEN